MYCLRRQTPDLAGRQLDSQWQVIEPPANRGNGLESAGIEREGRVGGGCAIGEKLDRGRGGRSLRLGYERGETIDVLAADMQDRAADCQDAQRGAGVQQPRQYPGRAWDLLQIVEHQQHASAVQAVAKAFGEVVRIPSAPPAARTISSGLVSGGCAKPTAANSERSSGSFAARAGSCRRRPRRSE